MPYTNNSNQNRQQPPQITTSMISFWDSNGMQLRVAGVESGLQIAIWTPTYSPDGRRTYPVEGRVATLLTQKNCYVLQNLLFAEILPAYEQGRSAKAGVFTNNVESTMVEIAVEDGGKFTLTIYRGCDPSTRIPSQTFSFTFSVSMVVKNYNPINGDIEVEPIQAEFFLFAHCIKGYNNMASGSIAGHGSRVANAYNDRRLMEYIQAIANAVNAQIPTSNYQRGGYNSTPNQGYSQAGNQAPVAPPPASPIEVDDVAALLG